MFMSELLVMLYCSTAGPVGECLPAVCPAHSIFDERPKLQPPDLPRLTSLEAPNQAEKHGTVPANQNHIHETCNRGCGHVNTKTTG